VKLQISKQEFNSLLSLYIFSNKKYMLQKLKEFYLKVFAIDSKKLKDVSYAIFIFILLFLNFFNNYIIQSKLERMQSNFFHIFEISQEKFDAMEEINLRIFNSILNNQTRKTFVVGNLTQKNTLLSESLQNNIMNFISDNSTTILAVSGVVLAIGIYYCWQAPINAWFLSFFNNKPKDDDDNKGNGGGSSDVGGNNNGGGSSDIGGNNDVADISDVGDKNNVADSSDVGEYSSNAIIPYDEQSATIQEILDLIKPNEFSHNFFTLTNRRGEMVTVDLDFIRQVFPQIYVKNGTPFVRYSDNTEQPLRELKIEDLVSLLDYEYTCALRSENLDHTTEHKEGAISDISDLIEILCKENL
jgi:hypothetical protein